MKKALVLFFGLMTLSLAYSAQVAWGVGQNGLPGFPGTVTAENPWGDIAGALVFLVQGSNVSATLDQVTASETAATDFINSYASKTNWSGILNANGGMDIITAADADAGTYFAIIFSADQKYALASNAKEFLAFDPQTPASADQTFAGTDFAGFATDWTEVAGTGGGSDSGVPEPTALALLALGVAGLALRRRA